MTSSVPYLVKALYDWILDNQCTPYLIVDATVEGASVPRHYVKDGRIVLNISPVAVRNLLIDKDCIEFGGRFSGVHHEIHVPIQAVLGIVSKENNEGMWFPQSEEDPDEPPPPKRGPPKLRLVE